MYNAESPQSGDMADYDVIADSRSTRNKARLVELRDSVAMHYGNYYGHGTDVDLITKAEYVDDDRCLLRENFSRLDKGKKCDFIRDEILSRTKGGRCPYCRLEEATTLDHIIGKETHPEYAALRVNLAPVCSRCNTLKETNSRRVAGRRKLHLYFHGYPTHEFLTAGVVLSSSSVAFEFGLTPPRDVNPDWWDALEAHFISLDLASRYAKRAHTEMQDRKHLLVMLHDALGPGGVAKYLRIDATSIAHNWSDQDWLPVLLNNSAASEEFCDRGIRLL